MDLDFLKSLQNAHPKVLVVGDIMLDRYTQGLVERISPEAPVLVLRVDSEEVRLGGAASVSALLRGLGAEVDLAGTLGTDASATIVRKLFREAGIGTDHIIEDAMRPTTVKWRVLGRPEHRIAGHLLRVDYESRESLETELESKLLENVIRNLRQYAAVLVSDYGKGVCTPKLLKGLIAEARKCKIPVLIDPVCKEDFEKYRGATLLKPNRATAGIACGQTITSIEEALTAAHQLRETLDLPSVVITLDREGMVLDAGEECRGQVKATARHVRDITGAGDMAQAMLGFASALHIPLERSLELANLASGLEVEREGVEPVTWEEIMSSLSRTSNPCADKIVSQEQLELIVRRHRADRKRVVLTNGCFDLLHVGHVTYLQEAARLGDLLIVAINTDSMVRYLKGPDRPINSEQHRAIMLAGMGCVDHVVVFEEETPHALLRRICPDILVKGGTYSIDEVMGREIVEQYGGEVLVMGEVPNISTTHLIHRIYSTTATVNHLQPNNRKVR